MRKIKLIHGIIAGLQKQSKQRRAASYLLILVIAAALLAPVGPSSTLASPETSSTDLQGEIEGAPYKIRVPSNWNGTLLVYLHGYRPKANGPGEVDDRHADAAEAPPPFSTAAFEQLLLSQGFALAGSAFSDNGYVVKEGIKDARRLTDFFIEKFGRPRHTILWGVSQGTLIALKSLAGC